jgi:phosphoribosyl-ATP pyrophosphohydrolase/phosphoribosyl-AMP cyclohydrolase
MAILDKPDSIKLNFEKGSGLIPAIIQDAVTNEVLMLGYMNQEAYMKTLEEGRVTFYSRSKTRLWTKGETSGNWLNVVNIQVDCDKDTLLFQVNPVGPVCHRGSQSCFDL